MSSYIDWIRKHVEHEKILLVFASACIRDNNGRLLWQRRADFGWWGLPGGVLELGESLSECIMREVREETGLKVEPLHLIGIYSSPDFNVTYPNGDQVQQITVCFDCRIVGGKLKVDKDETLDLAWFPIDEIPTTASWYMAMVNDLVMGQKAASFD
jgi:ADP-ribose pyrophosphatase YjhB (NUDIX family)